MANDEKKMGGMLVGLLDGRFVEAPAVLTGNAVMFRQVNGLQHMVDQARAYAAALEWIHDDAGDPLPAGVCVELDKIRKVLRAVGTGEVVNLPPAKNIEAHAKPRRLTWRERITGRIQA